MKIIDHLTNATISIGTLFRARRTTKFTVCFQIIGHGLWYGKCDLYTILLSVMWLHISNCALHQKISKEYVHADKINTNYTTNIKFIKNVIWLECICWVRTSWRWNIDCLFVFNIVPKWRVMIHRPIFALFSLDWQTKFISLHDVDILKRVLQRLK